MHLRHIARQAGLAFLYAAALSFSLWFSFLLRFDFNIGREYEQHLAIIFIGILVLKLLLLLVFGQFGSLLSYFGVRDAERILGAMVLAAIAIFSVWQFFGIVYAPPRAVIITDLLLSLLALCSLRLGFRLLREGYFGDSQSRGARRKNVVIVGAGDVGASLAKDLLARGNLGMHPLLFLDDDRAKWGTSIHGVTVKGPPDQISSIVEDLKIEAMIIAMPRAPRQRIREVVQLASLAGIKCEIVPSVEQLVTGQVRVSQIRPVDIEDLLGREQVCLETDRIRQFIEGRGIMVTGAGGSIGSELCRQIAELAPACLLLVERSETQLFQVEQELIAAGLGTAVVPLVADILDQGRMREIFARFRPRLVFHAAAHKHVPMMEHQPFEALQNNALGTARLADCASAAGVERFVLISTDKAINPTSVMGATKRLAELYLQNAQCLPNNLTKFIAVRFGNVLGSSGSVVPTFKRQIAAGGPVTVTHPEVSRYFMTVREAVGLVLQSATQGQGGEIFLLDMGQPVKIAELARQLIELSGFVPNVDIEIKYTGLRPGEKLHEELNQLDESIAPTDHPKIARLLAETARRASLPSDLAAVCQRGAALSANNVKSEIKTLVPEYYPFLGSD